MFLKTLKLQNFRNFESDAFDFNPTLTVITGVNGSGKTSILEAVSFLSYSRSFRTSRLNRIISHDKNEFTLFASINNNGQTDTLGLSRNSQGEGKTRINQKKAKSTADCATILPVLLFNPERFRLFTDGSKVRRRLMDWGVFYQSREFAKTYQYLKRTVDQRNAALKQRRSQSVIQSFDDAFLAQAATVDACRQTYTEALFSEVENLMGDFLTQHNISLHYYRGWGQDKDLPTLLDENFKKDIDAGFTQYGPHRADIRLRVGTALAQDVLSRGQQKRLIFSLTLAQATLYQAHQNQACVLLLDDVHAELDAQHFEALLGQAMALSMQVVMTSVNPDITSKLPSDQFTLISL